MVKKTSLILIILAVITVISQSPSVIDAQETVKRVTLFGEIVSVSPDGSQITLMTSDGALETLALDEADIKSQGDEVDASTLQLGQRSVIVAEEMDRVLFGSKVLVRPDKPSIHHYTAIVEDKTEAGVQLGFKGNTLTVDPVDGTEIEVGQIVTSVVRDGSNTRDPEMKSFNPFLEVIKDIGQNLEKGDLVEQGIQPGNVAIDILDELGSLAAGLPEQARNRVQEAFRITLEESIPEKAWEAMPEDTDARFSSVKAWQYMPNVAFGLMKDDVLASARAEAFENIAPEAFANINPEAFEKMRPEAFGRIHPEAFEKISPEASEHLPEAFRPKPGGDQPSGDQPPSDQPHDEPPPSDQKSDGDQPPDDQPTVILADRY